MREIDDILVALKKITGAKNDKELSEILKFSYSSLDRWKAEDKIPAKRIMEFSEKLGVGVDTIMRGSFNQIGINNRQNFGLINENNANIDSNDKIQEFLILFKKYGNEQLIDSFIEKLKKIENLSKG
ncbi:helix-turn-helix domain-containing protein [Campylobacter gastrosuis]|uniref:Helix-turn-helix domain containing protein n=1 Tax=Campylobacter gastrosuis TaxID=2974576 RepID=A0ABT7HNL3_9BACT|nr:helix-turn-helix domain-containing protein [Campylobacter gastrosuis]MDL0088498.1 helix-turn-helix domain containing protein [Campylobacter gastrosuis]